MTLLAAVEGVLQRDACSGCGLCVRLDPGLEMHVDEHGYSRPCLVGESRPIARAEQIFARSCPGVVVAAPALPPGAKRHPELGTYLEAWQAWAADPEVRRAGSSGGALTALHTWLVSTGRATRITGAAGSAEDVRRTVPVTIMTREQALGAAGSRYAPISTLANPDVLARGAAVTGKPCEIAALRRAAPDLVDGEAPLMLSFFCAGTPSQHATDDLLQDLGVTPAEPVTALRYRGDGWPGRFIARTPDREVSADYDDSWGRVLGPTTQWRCKVCVDGVGESADIVCADSWATDERGYPVFVEGDGVSALIARTPRGLETIRAAAEAGVIVLGELPMSQLAAAQPLQVTRKRFLFARLLGSRFAGRRPPRYRGFGLARLSLAYPREAIRTFRGTYRRVRAQRRR
ncbi:hypothetical protein E0W80_12740 [Microbacterium sp. PI-1]|uniref:Coenzyme F420 hydrogenase/dehydrogenase, beta subunit C-terminal domain n=1 Tax=unclassified Microbacterium TaxID=2609290 RepID=UPI0006463015|nr:MULTISPECIES: Coenzyme F420 hydrogenase/dehydrogenase, beta subunit C-terminal domain [unclassified Microbacterium]TCJ22801.1 hypothetical protein E0W80_12740 [Microbacterium sp. PI-1]